MSRTTPEAVEALLDYVAAISLAPFIETANFIVTKLCSDSGYEEVQLELIERWVAAHFYHIRQPQFEQKQVMSARKAFNFTPGFGFQLTRYGQQAMMLDTAGNLAEASKPQKVQVGINYLGIPPIENPRDPRNQ